ncbi:hypothetical protein FS749_000880, partial [Ceratobasidium sp. UAMH 11750]
MATSARKRVHPLIETSKPSFLPAVRGGSKAKQMRVDTSRHHTAMGRPIAALSSFTFDMRATLPVGESVQTTASPRIDAPLNVMHDIDPSLPAAHQVPEDLEDILVNRKSSGKASTILEESNVVFNSLHQGQNEMLHDWITKSA